MMYQRDRRIDAANRRALRVRRLVLERMEDRRLLSAAPAMTLSAADAGFADFTATDAALVAVDWDAFTLRPWSGESGFTDITFHPDDVLPIIADDLTGTVALRPVSEGGWIDLDVSAHVASTASAPSVMFSFGAGDSQSEESLSFESHADAAPPEQRWFGDSGDAARPLGTLSDVSPPTGTLAERTDSAEKLSAGAREADSVIPRLHQLAYAPITPADLSGEREGGLIDVTRVVNQTVYSASEAESPSGTAGRTPDRAAGNRAGDAAQEAKVIAPSRARSQAFEVVSAEEPLPRLSARPAAANVVHSPVRLVAHLRTAGRAAAEPLPSSDRVAGPAAETASAPSGEPISAAVPLPSASTAAPARAATAAETALAAYARDAVFAATIPGKAVSRYDESREDRPRLDLATLPVAALGFILYHSVFQDRPPHEDRPRRLPR